MTEKSPIIAFSDGSSYPNPGDISTGWVLTRNRTVFKQGGSFLGHGTNNVAELTAIIEIFLVTPPDEKLIIVTDSQYCITTIKSKNYPQANVELVLEARKFYRSRKVKIEKIKGHSGHPMNELADEIAEKTRKEKKFVGNDSYKI